MDVEYLPFSQELMALTGNTLNIEKNTLLQSSLAVLQNENHFRKVYFWGKIFGLDCDYYVAFGYTKDILKGAVFFYSKNAIDWVLLPKANEEHYFLTSIITSRIIGDPSLVATILDDAPTVEELNREEPMLLKNKNVYHRTLPVYHLKEEDRLAVVIRLITREGMVVPRGSLFKRTNGCIVPNESWYGMNYEDSRILSNYCHFRKPLQKWDVNLTKRPDYNYALDFMDPVDTDIPQHFSWSCQTVNTNRVACIRSLHWPGAVSFNVLESHIFGCLYFGVGKRNLDIPFMI